MFVHFAPEHQNQAINLHPSWPGVRPLWPRTADVLGADAVNIDMRAQANSAFGWPEPLTQVEAGDAQVVASGPSQTQPRGPAAACVVMAPSEGRPRSRHRREFSVRCRSES